jgi:FixJ family two-component response regulator
MTNDVMGRPSISIVDDDESFREAMCGTLNALGYSVRAFPSAEALLDSSTWMDADCLLVDATMPGASGPELQEKLSAEHGRIPIIFVTGYGGHIGEALRARVMAQGAVACLCKPFEEDELVAALGRAIGTA